MKKKQQQKLLIQGLGKGHQESYLEASPHRFSKFKSKN
jgi:hypothetical protein